MPESRVEICAEPDCQTPAWCDWLPNGQPQCRACRITKFFDRTLYRPIGFTLLPWQRKILRDIYGSINIDTGLRKYREAYVSVPKKSGKSFLCGGLPIYHLLMEHELNPAAYGAAASVDQASLVFNAAASLIRKNPNLLARLKILDSTKRIMRKDGGGTYRVLSADGDIQDGIEPSLAIKDELHRWKTAKSVILDDVMTKGMISRREPLEIKITTAGEVHDSPLCLREHEYAEQLLSGALKSDRYYAAIWSADKERIKKDPEYWKSREARVQANPSHEDNGGFLKDEALTNILDKSIAQGSQNSFLRYHLNIWVESEERYISAADWAKGNVPLRPLMDRRCWAGIDLSSTTDLTSVEIVFEDEDGSYDVLSHFWMAKERIPERERQDKVPYSAWERAGHLTATEGWSVDYSYIREYLRWAKSLYQLQEICYDPWHAAQLVEGKEGLIADGFLCVKVSQNFSLLSEPTKKTAALVGEGKLRHGGHPILTWNADCATVKADHKDNVMLTKPDRKRSSKRIDGMAALVNAMARAIVSAQETAEPRVRFF